MASHDHVLEGPFEDQLTPSKRERLSLSLPTSPKRCAPVDTSSVPCPGDTPGGRILSRLLQLLSKATSTVALQDLIRSYAFFYHRARVMSPRVLLKNGFLYTVPFQPCGDPYCSKKGYTVRQWSLWWRARGWHPPMSASFYPLTKLLFSPCEKECFGSCF
jgi:hypothetical protein